MSFRELLVRHRKIAAAIAAPTALGVAAIVAVSLTPPTATRTADTQLKASVTECHDMVTISVAGRGDSPAAGTTKLLVGPHGEELPAAMAGDYKSQWEDPIINAPAGAVSDPNSYAAMYIAYPADMATYEDAVNAGVANTEKVMTEIRMACPNTKFAIVGYSEGADVARRVAMQVGNQQADKDGNYGIVDPNKVTGVVILADSGRSAGEGPFPGAKDPNHPDGFDQKYQNGGVQPISGQGALPDNAGGFGALNGKVASFCSEGDLTCAAPQNVSLLQLVVNVGRQINADKLEKEGLNPATGQDVAVTLGHIAFNAFNYISTQPNWMASNETFLSVLLRVSDPAYKPGQTPPPAPAKADAIAKDQMSPLAYLPQKVFNEIVGLIVTNQNTIPVIMSDPYQLTLGPNASGHHFDYWHNADPADGRPMTSAEYAAAWLTHLAQQAQAGQQVDTNYQPNSADLAAAYKAADSAAKEKTNPPVTTTPAAAPTTTSAAPTTTSSTAPTTTSSTAPTTTSAAPTTTPTGSATATTTPEAATTPEATTAPEATTTAPTTTPAAPTTPQIAKPVMTTPAPITTTSPSTTPTTAPVR
ncbi:cutinase family protein [Nocardia sp. NPDC051570]|uniref:cutinase family protein n=1 Tax=Nocardia sp. NPDC051570 TaxID=3364324 RepID=UPI0037AD57B3